MEQSKVMILILSAVLMFALSTSHKIPLGQRPCTGQWEIGPADDVKLLELLHCDVIEGSLAIANINYTLNATQYLPIQEITEYLLIYRVSNLHSLERLLPNLTLIRGDVLFGHYSLIIYENPDLLDIGLRSLVAIQHGSVRVERNPLLCYVETISWMDLLQNMSSQHYVLKENMLSNHCLLCKGEGGKKVYCWNQDSPQKICPKNCAKGSCNANGECCKPSCLGGCDDTQSEKCSVCRNLKSRDGYCTNSCKAAEYKLANRRCVPDIKCTNSSLIPYNGECVENCPDNYQEKDNSCQKCEGFCRRNCTGTVIQRLFDAANLTGCTYISGSLVIELLYDRNTKIIEELERSLQSIREITGYLKIANSPQITSLSFLKNLETIKGEELIGNLYSLYVVNNYHLEHLWGTNKTVQILYGKIFFHFNPKLCYKKIQSLLPHINSTNVLSVPDVSPFTNGERATCEFVLTKLPTSVEAVNATAARIKIEPQRMEDNRGLLGYLYYYKETSEQNLDIFDSRHGCGYDKWNIHLDLSKNVRHMFHNLKPDTQYGYFVRTFTIVTTYMQPDFYSKVDYFRTLPYKPDRIWKFFYYAESDTEVTLHWWPPRYPNGPIKYYVIETVPQTSKDEYSESSDVINGLKRNISTISTQNNQVRKNKNGISRSSDAESIKCVCPGTNDWRGYAHVDEDYYDKTEITFEDIISNFIYMTNKITNRTTKDDNSDEEEGRLNDYLEYQHRILLKKYDTGIDDFIIVQTNGTCSEKTKSGGIDNCHLNGTIVDGNTHSTSLTGLMPNRSYLVSIRACGNFTINTCSSQTLLSIKTLDSKEFP